MSGHEDRTEKATPRRRARVFALGVNAQSQITACLVVMLLGVTIALEIRSYCVQWPRFFIWSSNVAVLSARMDASVDLLRVAISVFSNPKFFLVTVTGFMTTLVAATAAAAFCGPITLRSAALMPMMARLTANAGWRRLFSAHGAWHALAGAAGSVLLASVGIPPLVSVIGALAQTADLNQQLALTARVSYVVFVRVVAVMVMLAVFDVVFQRRRLTSALLMTPRELRDERRQTEGRPETKQRRRSISARLARGLLVEAIRRSTALLTNPTHLAVARRYAPPAVDVPVVVARVADHLVPLARKTAHSASVPVIESPELARMLYVRVGVDEPIPADAYAAVAAIFTWIIRTRGRLAGGDNPDH